MVDMTKKKKLSRFTWCNNDIYIWFYTKLEYNSWKLRPKKQID